MGAGADAHWRLELAAEGGKVIRGTLWSGGAAMTIGSVIAAWRKDADFAAFWTRALGAVPFEAYCWEMPPLTNEVMQRRFECRFVGDDDLAGPAADPEPFRRKFAAAGDAAVATFVNLSGDAVLVAPCPDEGTTAFAHLAAFCRSAGRAAAVALWQAVAAALDARMGGRPVWLSTAGHGVAWVHVRIDRRPKYFSTRAYAAAGFWGAGGG